MPPTPKNITDTLIIPPGSEERFIRFSPLGATDGWLGQGVHLAGISRLRPGYQVRREACRHHFMAYVKSGAPVFGPIAGAQLFVSPGQVVFLPAGERHHYLGNGGFSMIWFHLQSSHKRWRHLAGRTSFQRPARQAVEVASLMENAFDEAQSPSVPPHRVAPALCQLITAYLDRDLERESAGGEHLLRSRLERVWQEVGRQLAGDWSVVTLARKAGLSVSHFHAAVRQTYQMSPMQIIRDLRISRAQALLQNTTMTLEEVAGLTGYASPFSLSRTFKTTTGFSPRAYRAGIRR